MQYPTTPQPIPAPRHRTPRRHWLILAGLFLLSQLLNVWIITRTVSGGFEGWLDGLRSDAGPAVLTATDARPATALVMALPQADTPPPTPGRRP